MQHRVLFLAIFTLTFSFLFVAGISIAQQAAAPCTMAIVCAQMLSTVRSLRKSRKIASVSMGAILPGSLSPETASGPIESRRAS